LADELVSVEQELDTVYPFTVALGQRYGKYLPARISDHYLTALDDQDLLSGRDSVALADARINDLLSKVNTGETGSIWNNLKTAHYELKRAQVMGDANAGRAAMAEIESLIHKGSSEYQSWKEIFDLIDLRRRLAESEHKRLVSLQQVFTAEQGMKLIRFLIIIIRKHVKDPAILQAISDEISTRLATTMNPHNVY